MVCTLTHASCLRWTYSRESGLPPTRTTPRPGGRPRLRVTSATCASSSACHCPAIFLPSRTAAVWPEQLFKVGRVVATVTRKLSVKSLSVRPYPIVCELYILLTLTGLAACHKHVYRRWYAFINDSNRRFHVNWRSLWLKRYVMLHKCKTFGKRDDLLPARQRSDLADTRA